MKLVNFKKSNAHRTSFQFTKHCEIQIEWHITAIFEEKKFKLFLQELLRAYYIALVSQIEAPVVLYVQKADSYIKIIWLLSWQPFHQ